MEFNVFFYIRSISFRSGSNKISFHEFAEAFVSKKRVSTSQEQLWRVFHDADRDHDQYLTRTECFAALKQLGHVMDDRGIKRVMSIMDKNGDGRISFQGKSLYVQPIYGCCFSFAFICSQYKLKEVGVDINIKIPVYHKTYNMEIRNLL